MLINCRRCGHRGEIRKGSVTGNNVTRYAQLTSEIERLGVVSIQRGSVGRKPLCLACLSRLSNFLKGE